MEDEIINKEVYIANENTLLDKDRKELKQMTKEGKLVVCSKCEYLRYKVYAVCCKCGHKEEIKNESL